MRKWLLCLVASLGLASWISSCGSSKPGASLGPDSGSGVDSSVLPSDAAADAGASDAPVEDAGGYNDMTNPSYWSTFDTSSLNTLAIAFAGGTFDGRYLYLSPNMGSIVARYDTQGAFTAAGSWSTFDVSKLNANDTGFAGALFDGRYVYLVPSTNSLIARFDTKGTFTSQASWIDFDTSLVVPNGTIYNSGTFDGKYMYFAPNSNSLVARYNTKGPSIEAGADWSNFDVSGVNASAGGFSGDVFDGRYVYFIPYDNNSTYDGVVARYDTQATTGFEAGVSWGAFDTASLDSNAIGFQGGAFDGRYLYLVPHYSPSGVIARCDTTMASAFTKAAAWTTAPTPTGASGFSGGAFDGRYVYLVPNVNGFKAAGVVARYDSTAPFGPSSSWAMFDTATLGGAVSSFFGAVFDGRYLYLVPSITGTVARFDAKAMASMPDLPDFHGSFF
jgi:hypothetical protein